MIFIYTAFTVNPFAEAKCFTTGNKKGKNKNNNEIEQNKIKEVNIINKNE